MAGAIKTKHRSNQADTIVGKNVKSLRVIRGLSQKALGDAIGVTFQQIQKYEDGKNRISASVLYKFSQFFNIDIRDFFQGLESGTSQDQPLVKLFQSLDKDTVEMLMLFQSISSKEVKKSLINVLKSLNADEWN